MLVYDALTADLNRRIPDPARRIRPTRFLSRRETLELFPAITSAGLTGAAIFEDGQMYNPPRLVLAFASAAGELGAAVANYVEAQSLLIEDSRVVGVTAVDRLAGARFDIRARLVINAAGGWSEGLLQQSFGQRYGAAGTYSRDTCFVVARTGPAMALAIQGRSRDADALLARPARHLFMVPWRNFTLIGVWHSIVRREPDTVALPRSELLQFLAEVNDCYPALELRESEVQRVDFGLVPFGDSSRQQGGLSFGKQSRLIDHRNHGVTGLISLINVRYTVARRDAFDALNVAELQLGVRRGGRAESERRPLHGGNLDDFLGAVRTYAAARPAWFPPAAIESLVRNYGSNTARVLSLAQHEPRLRRCFPGSQVTHAEAAYAVREEKALRMSDVVFRRTELGTAGYPGTPALLELQTLLRDELAWSEQRAAQELELVEHECARYLADRRPAPQTLAHDARHSVS
jgi:glycerol-3-phosphate dehydrogenase